MSATETFREAILEHGWDPGAILPDGRLHRFSEPERRDKTCWYVLHDMGAFAAGAFGNWREGTSHKWTSRNGTGLSEDERRAWQGKQAEIEARQKNGEQKAKERAAYIWAHAAPAPAEHPYLAKKGIGPHIARAYKGLLVVPVYGPGGDLASLQLIGADGTKRFLTGGRTKSGYFVIEGGPVIALVEGFATGCSENEATGHTVYGAFSAANLAAVAEYIRRAHPGRRLIVCSDNDQWTHKPDGTTWNVGKEKAMSIAWRLNVKVAIPELSDIGELRPTDFNDLHALTGPESVKAQIDAALLPQDWLLKECSENGPGAAWRPENIEGLKLLRERDPASYRDLREKLRRLRVGITDLEKQMHTQTGQDGGGFSHLGIAKRVVEAFGPDSIIYSNGWFWLWQESGVWKRADDRSIKTAMKRALSRAKNGPL